MTPRSWLPVPGRRWLEVIAFSVPFLLSGHLLAAPLCGPTPCPQLKSKRTTVNLITAGTSAETSVLWDSNFVDTDYTVACTVQESVDLSTAQSLIMERVRLKAINGVTLSIRNNGITDRAGEVNCIAIHD